MKQKVVVIKGGGLGPCRLPNFFKKIMTEKSFRPFSIGV